MWSHLNYGKAPPWLSELGELTCEENLGVRSLSVSSLVGNQEARLLLGFPSILVLRVLQPFSQLFWPELF